MWIWRKYWSRCRRNWISCKSRIILLNTEPIENTLGKGSTSPCLWSIKGWILRAPVAAPPTMIKKVSRYMRNTKPVWKQVCRICWVMWMSILRSRRGGRVRLSIWRMVWLNLLIIRSRLRIRRSNDLNLVWRRTTRSSRWIDGACTVLNRAWNLRARSAFSCTNSPLTTFPQKTSQTPSTLILCRSSMLIWRVPNKRRRICILWEAKSVTMSSLSSFRVCLMTTINGMSLHINRFLIESQAQPIVPLPKKIKSSWQVMKMRLLLAFFSTSF